MVTSHSGEFPTGAAPFATLRESNRSLRSLFVETNGESKSDSILTFFPDQNPAVQPPMAFAGDLFQNGVLSPLPSPALKLPPRLQEVPSPRSPHTPAPPRKAAPASRWKDFDPFEAAVERIRKDDSTVMTPFYWRALERSFEQSFIRVMEEDEKKGGSEWDIIEGSSQRIVVCTSRKHKWNPLSCLGSQ